MSKEFMWALLKRFARVFVSGAIAEAILYVQAHGIEVASAEQMKVWAVGLGIVALTGGLAALEKALRYKKEADSGLAKSQ